MGGNCGRALAAAGMVAADAGQARSRGLTLEDLRRDVAALIGAPASSVGDNDDLIGMGVDSIGVMKLASLWREAASTRSLPNSSRAAHWLAGGTLFPHA